MSATSQQYLIAVAIGPVQDFIAASRKTRDLWFGSMLLGKVSRAAAVALENHIDKAKGDALIFPFLGTPEPRGKETPVPNKLLAIVTTDEPNALTGKVRDAAQAVLDASKTGYVDEVRNRLGADAPVDWDLVEPQVKDFLEFYAAWVPYPTEGYERDRLTVERLLAGRKALRNFNAAPCKPATAKSSLDPSRETVFTLRDGSALRAGKNLSEPERSALKVKGAEQLDGVSLIKRHGNVNRLVSVSRVAVDPLIRRLQGSIELGELNLTAKALIKTDLAASFEIDEASGLSHYRDFPYDCQLFYRDGGAEEGLTKAQLERAATFYETVQKACKKHEIAEPPAYFAVLVADGDRMGKSIEGLTTPELHRTFSELLSGFAANVDGIVQKQFGAPIYSGGDDVLAFLPVDTAIACAKDLSDAFGAIAGGINASIDEHNEKLAEDVQRVEKIAVTLSVGISIGHYHANLNDLLEWGREAERFAKSNGRNSLAVALHTASGGGDSTIVAHRWDATPLGPLARWTEWVDWHNTNRFPDGAAFELRDLARDLANLDPDAVEKRVFTVEETVNGETARAPRSLLELELARILARKRPEHGVSTLEPDQIKTLVDAVSCDDVNTDRSDVKKLAQLANELIIARRIAAITEIASPRVKPTRDEPKEDAGE